MCNGSKKPTYRSSRKLKYRQKPSFWIGYTTDPLQREVVIPKVESRDEQDIPLVYHADCLIRGLWRWFKGINILYRVLLGLVALYLVFIIANMLIQFLILLMNPMYTILGIIASAIVIYEFWSRSKLRV